MGDTSDPEAVGLRQQLAALRHELDDLRQHLPDALVEGDLATERVTFMNRLACLVFRRSPEEVAGLHGRDLFADGEFERAQQEMRETLARGYAQGGAYQRSGHQDLREFQSLPGGVRQALEETYHPNIRAIRALEKPVLAAVNGPCAGAGLSVAGACDVRIASADATFVPVLVRDAAGGRRKDQISTDSSSAPCSGCAAQSCASVSPVPGTTTCGAISANGLSTNACLSSGRGMRRLPGPSSTRSSNSTMSMSSVRSP